MTRYDLFRRRIAPIAFALALGAIAYDACNKQQRTHATIVIDLGDARPRVAGVEAELIVDGEAVGRLHRASVSGSLPLSFAAAMPDDDGELRIDVALDGGARKTIVRRIHAKDGATVTVSIAGELP